MQERLDEEFPQFDDITKRIVGYLYDRIYDPEKPRTAVFIPIVSVQGLGKSTFGASFWRYLGIVQGYIEHRCVDGEPFMPVESILKLAERQPDPIFGVRGVLVIDEMHRIQAPQEEPDYNALYAQIYDETYRTTYDDLHAQWERVQREGARQLVIESVAASVAQPPVATVTPSIPITDQDQPLGEPAPVLSRREEKKRRQQQGGHRPSPTITPQNEPVQPLPPPPSPRPTIVIQLPENRGGEVKPPRELELEAQKAGKAAATAAVAAARKNWRLYLERRQTLRDALSGNGEVAVRNSPLPGHVARLRALVGGYALESLRTKETHARLIRNAEAELAAAIRVLDTMPAAPFLRAREIRTEMARVQKEYDRLLRAHREAVAAAPSGTNVPSDPSIGQKEEILLRLTDELEALPSAEETKRYDGLVTERTRKEEGVATAKRNLEDALAKHEETLVGAIEQERLAEGLLEAEPELMNIVGSPDPNEELEFLLTEIDFMKRRLAKQPADTIKKILAYMKQRPEVPSRRADGIFIFALGNYPAYDEEVTKRASNPRDPDSCAASDEAFRGTPEGRRMFEEYTLARIGRAVAKRGERDDDQASMVSRVGGYFEPRRRLTSKKWYEIIRRNLRQLHRKAIAVMRADFGYEVDDIVFDDSMFRMLFESGANAESDLRLFTPLYDAFTSVFWPSLKKVLEKGGVGRVDISYNFEQRSIEFRAHPKAAPPRVALPLVGEASQPPPPVATPEPRLLSVSFTPNMELQRVDAVPLLNPDEEELLAYREAARAVVGAIVFGTLPKAVQIVPSRGRSQSVFWTRPAPQMRAWGFHFGDILGQLAAVRAEYRWTSGAPYDETRAYRETLKTALVALYREFTAEHTARDVAPTLQVFRELTPSWFQNLPLVSNVFKTATSTDLFAMAETVVTTILGSDDFEPMVRKLSTRFLDVIRKKQPITNELINEVFLEDGARFTIDLHFRLHHLDPGSVRVPPERCDYVLAKKKEDADSTAPIEVHDRTWRAWLRSWVSRGEK